MVAKQVNFIPYLSLTENNLLLMPPTCTVLTMILSFMAITILRMHRYSSSTSKSAMVGPIAKMKQLAKLTKLAPYLSVGGCVR